MRRRFAILAWMALLALPACDGDDEGITGRYVLQLFDAQDTCDQETNQFATEMTITRVGDGFRIRIGDVTEVTGALSGEGVLVAEGNVVTQIEGATVPAFLQMGIVIRRGQIVEGLLRMTFEGTFPQVPTRCVQEFTTRGERLSLAPILG